MADKPRQWSIQYASIFQDGSVVDAYQFRPNYPPETFSFLFSLIPPAVRLRTVLDAGCGTGFIARPFAPFVDWIDAVDISQVMIRKAQTLPGGNHPNIHWIAEPIESAPLGRPYALIVAAASLHWMDWDRVLPRFAAHLAPGCVLAIVEEVVRPNPWDRDTAPILRRYSMNLDFTPYTMMSVVEELEQRQLFVLQGNYETAPATFSQPVSEWVESFHARNGFSRDRMGKVEANACDTELRSAIQPYCPDGVVKQAVGARILWGRPREGIQK